MKKEIVLGYHSIDTPSDQPGAKLYCLSLERFREQIVLIAKTREHLAKNGDGDPIISFDDGDITNYTKAYPILNQLGLKAYFFILAGCVGSEGYMNWEQIKELSNAGMIIGSHGMTHRILTSLNEKELDYELKDSKKILEDKLKIEINYFSVPKGHYNKHIIDKIMACGYKAVFTSNPEDRDGFFFGRIPVKANWDLKYFSKVINSGLPLKDRTVDFIKNSSKKILGAERYDKIRTRILKI